MFLVIAHHLTYQYAFGCMQTNTYVYLCVSASRGALICTCVGDCTFVWLWIFCYEASFCFRPTMKCKFYPNEWSTYFWFQCNATAATEVANCQTHLFVITLVVQGIVCKPVSWFELCTCITLLVVLAYSKPKSMHTFYEVNCPRLLLDTEFEIGKTVDMPVCR